MSLFESSVKSARELQRYEQTSPKINPACGSILLEHGHAVPRAVAFMHGITSSPVQFRDLGELFYARGYNVFIPRMPRHGYRDRLTPDHARLTVAEFKAYAARTVEVARGLGDHLTVAGLSVSGVLHSVPFRVVPALVRLGKVLPNLFLWWDLRRRAAVGPACSYPRFSTHAMAENFQLGLEIYQAARPQPPACEQILAVTNQRDPAVNNAATRAVLRRWRQHPSSSVREYAFGPDLGRLHDIIGPYQPNARVDYVYPILLDLIDRR